MTEFLDAIHAFGTWSAAALWLPLLAWTLLVLPFYVMVQRAERWHPLVRYRLLQALLFTLPAGLVAAAWIDASSLLSGWSALSGASPSEPTWILLPGTSAPSATPAPAESVGLDAFHAIGLFTAGAVLIGAVRLARLARSGFAVAALKADASHGQAGRVHGRIVDSDLPGARVYRRDPRPMQAVAASGRRRQLDDILPSSHGGDAIVDESTDPIAAVSVRD